MKETRQEEQDKDYFAKKQTTVPSEQAHEDSTVTNVFNGCTSNY